MKLSELKTGERGVIVKVNGHGGFRKRIQEMGFVKGNKVKVIVKFFGREMAHTELGAQLLDRFAEGCEEAAVIEKKPVLDGRNMTMILAPKKTK